MPGDCPATGCTAQFRSAAVSLLSAIQGTYGRISVFLYRTVRCGWAAGSAVGILVVPSTRAASAHSGIPEHVHSIPTEGITVRRITRFTIFIKEYICHSITVHWRAPMRRFDPPWEYLRTASISNLGQYELSRLNHAANLRKEMATLLDEWLEESVAALRA